MGDKLVMKLDYLAVLFGTCIGMLVAIGAVKCSMETMMQNVQKTGIMTHNEYQFTCVEKE